jgi:hypothetical protein
MTEINVGLIGYGMASRVFHTLFITTMRGLKLTKVLSVKAQFQISFFVSYYHAAQPNSGVLSGY